MAVSVELLAFYRALFERSCDAVNALVSALNSHYIRRGFHMSDRDGKSVQDPFRRSLGRAIQWFDVLQIEVERRVESILTKCRDRVSHACLSASGVTFSSQEGTCASLLVQRCPACFGGNIFGRSLAEGGDIHIAADGNFHHRHRHSAGDCPIFYDPVYFLPKAQVDAVGQRIEKARKCRPRKNKTAIPDEAIDQCQTSYEAVDGKKQKAAMDNFDNTGIMALICRHNIPLFFTNIDTPGEQQKYSIALIEHLFSLLPSQANVITLYDIGCVLSRSLDQVTIPAASAVSIILIVRQRRIWLIDRQAAAVGYKMRQDLGAWLKRQMKKGIEAQGSAAEEVLASCDVPVPELQSQWAKQREAQLSIRAHKLRKELDSVLALQADFDASERALQTARTVIERDSKDVSGRTLEVLDSMEGSHTQLSNKLETLYASLNVQDKFPELDGVQLDFVRILLMARDLKINIRKRAVGSFFEWDKLDRAVGGKDRALGTKLHQQTRKAITKRQPALMAAIRKFNRYCEQLEELYDPAYAIPLPLPLPMKLGELCGDPNLLQDVWISPSAGEMPRWLEDSAVRDGIRALLKRDRCREEQWHLGVEADNMCRWFSVELCAVELALQQSENSPFFLLLQHRCEAMQNLMGHWPTLLASTVRYANQASEVLSLAKSLSGVSPMRELHWLEPVICSWPSDDLANDEEDSSAFNEIGSPEEGVQEPNEVLLGDVLEGDDTNDKEGEIEDQRVILPVVTLLWQLPHGLKSDFINISTNSLPVQGIISRRIQPPTHGFPQLIFDPKDIKILASNETRLNDICLNGCVALLYSLYLPAHHGEIALFSTHDLPRIRYNASDDILWWTMSWTKYWEKTTWIIPIHRPSPGSHWVMCTIDLASQRLFLFDSLAEERPWKQEIQDILKLVCRLFMIAMVKMVVPVRDFGEWMAFPVLLHAIQTNGYDCGLWVLAQIAAVLRGCEITGLREEDMIMFRKFLYIQVLRIPTIVA
ncbi:hypothetical protein PISMIDRAFT_19325 [Pisolithus microcarpus 441]|uniref:Ubiquitin-like protease family profile domain-containing protein n=1 Tax=Pisolithus microcarpus 441 TaxID=765257 RepID=A0A0C9YUV9_9AGAM|nr:hypothetical protein PISMIDRAFT_19325 [Pisolithus microcarpus 441]